MSANNERGVQAKIPRLKAVLLCGGESRRMGSPKHLLTFNDRPVYQHLLGQLSDVSTAIQEVAISIHNDDASLGLMVGKSVPLLQDVNNTRIGPAAGLLAAHRHDGAAHWLILACDYPLIRDKDLKELLDHFEEPVTCFRNVDGFVEPLIGIWSPRALRFLEERVHSGDQSPSRAVKLLKGNGFQPSDPGVLFNANTKEDWDEVLRRVTAELNADELNAGTIRG